MSLLELFLFSFFSLPAFLKMTSSIPNDGSSDTYDGIFEEYVRTDLCSEDPNGESDSATSSSSSSPQPSSSSSLASSFEDIPSPPESSRDSFDPSVFSRNQVPPSASEYLSEKSALIVHLRTSLDLFFLSLSLQTTLITPSLLQFSLK